MFSLFRLPLGAFRPNDLMYVYEEDGRIAGLVRVERETVRDEWTIVELDAVGMADAGDIRFRLVQQLLREGAKRGAARFHVACADADGNVELFMQAGFMRYGEERVLFRAAGDGAARAVAGGASRRLPASARRRRSTPSPLARLYGVGDARPGRPPRGDPAAPTGSARARTGGSRAPASRRSCASPTSRASSRPRPAAARTAPSSTASSRSASPRRTSRTTSRSSPGPRPTSSDLVDFGLGVIAARTARGGDHRHDHGVIAPVRTYESPIDRRLEEAGFDSIASVTLLMKETLVRVAEPALVPAGVR